MDMMSPISVERLEFIKQRQQVLEISRRELIRRREYYKAQGATMSAQAETIQQIMVEQLRLQLEHEVIEAILKEQKSEEQKDLSSGT